MLKKEELILCIAPNRHGFGYALMSEALTVHDKGMVKISPASNRNTMKRITKLVTHLEPNRLIIESYNSKSCRKRKRVKELLKRIKQLALKKELELSEYSKNEIQTVFGNWKARTRYEIAEVIAEHIKGFKYLLYPKPKFPKIEHYNSPIFDAVALGVVYEYLNGQNG